MTGQPDAAVTGHTVASAEVTNRYERLYTTMRRIRDFEMTTSRLMLSGELPGFVHLSIGQEAVAAGVCDVLTERDYLTTTHRGHGHCIAKGCRVEQMMAELFGRRSGYCGGRSGSMHVADPALGILGANAIVAAGIPIAVGGALAASVTACDAVSVPFFGEGAVAEGAFHEALNMAALWRLPVVFVCENNGYAEMSPVSVHLVSESVTAYAAPHRIPARSVDGNDVLAVREAALAAVERARDGGGPFLIECHTYRLHGHYEGDPQKYREPDEIESWRSRDPLARLRRAYDHLVGTTSEVLDTIDVRIAHELEAAVSAARTSSAADGTDIMRDVYTDDLGSADPTDARRTGAPL